MNIAIIENHIISTNTVRRKLTQTLMDEGYNVTVISTGTTKELNFAKKLGFNIIDVGSSSTNPVDVIGYMRKIYSALRVIKADLCLTFTMRPAIWGNLVSRSMRIPVITNITGIGPLAESTSMAYRVARALYTGALRRTKVVFFQNEDDLQIFIEKKFIKKHQAQIIPGSGVDTDFFAPKEKVQNDEKFIFLFISRLIKDKGILEYVAAAEQIKIHFPHVICQVIGPYYDQNLKENTISEKQVMHWLDEGIINYLGAAEDVRPFIAAADCIVLPSYREGMSNVLLEASSMQKPTIASNVTGCKEIVIDNKTGFLCKVKDANDLLEQMKKMIDLSEEERVQMGIAGRKNIMENFTKKIVIDAYLKNIDEILTQKVTKGLPRILKSLTR